MAHNSIPAIGDNSKSMTLFEAASVDVDTLWCEAAHWLGGDAAGAYRAGQTQMDGVEPMIERSVA